MVRYLAWPYASAQQAQRHACVNLGALGACLACTLHDMGKELGHRAWSHVGFPVDASNKRMVTWCQPRV